MMLDDSARMPAPLSPAVLALLAHERALVPQADTVRARALARAREALRPIEVVRYTPRVAWWPARRLLLAAMAGILLMAGGAAAYQMLRRPEPIRPVATEMGRTGHRPSFAPHSAEPRPVLAPDVSPEPLAPTSASVAKAPEPSRRAAFGGKPDAPPEEVRLLVRARRSDARHDYAGVLAIAAEHERRHPTGRLAEEREALRVKALVGLKRGAEARQVAAKFRRQFPRSVLLHKIDDMLASLK